MQNYWKCFDIQPPYGLLRCNLHRNVKLASCSLKYAQLPSCSSKEHISAYLSTRLKERTETRKLVKTSRFSAEVNLCHLWESWNPGIYLIIPFFTNVSVCRWQCREYSIQNDHGSSKCFRNLLFLTMKPFKSRKLISCLIWQCLCTINLNPITQYKEGHANWD